MALELFPAPNFLAMSRPEKCLYRDKLNQLKHLNVIACLLALELELKPAADPCREEQGKVPVPENRLLQRCIHVFAAPAPK